jgi:RNA polymerase sigma-70 factor (ECF subfamily)
MVAQLPALRRYALGLSGSVPAADDLVQDCIERALRRAETLQSEDKMAGWLRSILFNLFVDGRRQMRHRGESVQLEVVENSPGHGGQPDRQHEAQQVLRATSFLSPEHRQVLLLVGVEGLSYREAAAELGVPVGTVMSRLARARDQLRAQLERGVPAEPNVLRFGRPS